MNDAAGQRRHDVDWLRVLALGLLIVYHGVLSFQPWAHKVFFLQNDQTLEGLWPFMAMLNVWRIPILFVVSGMGVRFAMERRDWKKLLKDRSVRILLPLLFGLFFICPISIYAMLAYRGEEAFYVPNAGHLWFLANIYLYVLLLLPLLVYLKNRPGHCIWRGLAGLCRGGWGLYLLALPMMAEAWLLKPTYYTLYAQTPHGFWLGMVCFLMGFMLVGLGDVFWSAVEKMRSSALVIAFGLYLVRLMVFRLEAEPHPLLAFESLCWMFAVLGHGSKYLNVPSAVLAYCSKAVYPVYIIHMPVQFGISYYLFPIDLAASAKLLMLLAGTFGCCLLAYEYVLRRLRWIRPLLGMRLDGG